MNDAKNNTFYVVDFDRTLVDSDKLLEVFVEISGKYSPISGEQIKRLDAEIKQRGDTLFLAQYIRTTLSEKNRLGDWEKLEKSFIHEARYLNFLLPGADEFLEWLTLNNQDFGILTYGDPLWQKLKLSATGFNHVRHIVTEHKEKGKLIAKWLQDDGGFTVPKEYGGGTYEKLVLIDDKAVSFKDMPSSAVGYWVLANGHELPSQVGDTDYNVTRYDNLLDILKVV